jgi:Sulfocyanin (SoxE) domain
MVATSTKDPTSSTISTSRRLQRYQAHRRRVRRRVIAVIGGVVLIVAIAAIAFLAIGGDDSTEGTVPYEGTTVKVILGDYVIVGGLTAPAGNVRLNAVNDGGIVHNVGIRGGPISGDMRPGGGFTVDLGALAPGTYQLYCDIPTHVEQGMIADLVIT